ncbi:hypothetical protein AWENTII_011289 [Aspergillus wentii]
MSLPPEQINIKRRREEEPVDTLYIQSELHQTKRRFTDFVFQRVQVKVGGDGRSSESSSPTPSAAAGLAAKRHLRSPRSVSSLLSPSAAHARSASTGGRVPMVRATSPGAEFRDEKRLAAARRENEEKLKRALHSSPASPRPGSGVISAASSGRGSPASSPGPLSVRKFQISRSSTPVGGGSLHRSTGSGVQKRRGDGVAVLVEQLRRKPHSRQASMVADLARKADDGSSLSVASLDGSVGSEEAPARPRKRPVVNQAEKRWREERKTAISAAKQHISHVLDKEAQTQHQSSWDDESERLAREFEHIALELDGDDDHRMEALPDKSQQQQPSPSRHALPKPALKFQPRQPNKPRPAAEASGKPTPPSGAAEAEADESDGEYVYDTYIRRPLENGQLTNPLVELERDQAGWLRQHGIDASRQDIGVIVITPEDEEYWENFAEDDDEEEWDSEDADSNAENNPANDYPDEELSWSDEDDDPSAIYSKYRRHGASDDEEFDFADSASEDNGARRFRFRNGLDMHVDSDEEGGW